MREHGTRACYVFGPEPGQDRSKGCRCESCANANRDYARQRYRDDNDGVGPAYVDNSEAAQHLRWLSGQGVGARPVSAATGLARSSIRKMTSGEVTKSKPETIAKILGVGTRYSRDGAYVCAERPNQQIRELLSLGWTKRHLASEIMGRPTPSLQMGDRPQITASHARRIEELWREHYWNDPKRVRARQAKRKERGQPLDDFEFDRSR